MKRVRVADLDVAEPLFDFIDREALPGSGVSPEGFWNGLAALVRDLGPKNRELLKIRDDLQAQLDDYLKAHRGKELDQAAYVDFLKQIGYLLPDGAPQAVETTNVD